MDPAERANFLPPQPYSNAASSYRDNNTAKMAKPTSYLKYIYVVLGLLVADAIISLAFLSTMVNFLHTVGAGPYRVIPPNGDSFLMHGEPANLLTNQGHTTNGAGGTVVVLLGFGGLIALIKENKSRKKHGKSSPLFTAWAVAVILTWLLILTALIYTNVVTEKTSGQSIDLKALALNHYPIKYMNDDWTPENWYKQVLKLPLEEGLVPKAIRQNLRVQMGWRYNLIALFIVASALVVLVVLEVLATRKHQGRYGRAEEKAEEEKAGEAPH